MENFLSDILSNSRLAIEEAKIFGNSGSEWWHSAIIEPDRNPIAGGFAADRFQARKIAIAEFLERKKFVELTTSAESVKQDWGIDIIPTACGFAAGFDKHNTVFRSIFEATERWVMSKWIDEKFYIEETPYPQIAPSLDAISLFFVNQFKSVKFFEKKILLPINNKHFQITVGQTMALTEEGIFPGSSAQYTGGNIWQHALLESFRHLLAVSNNPKRENKFPDNKIFFFSKNKDIALKQISQADKKNWPSPEIKLHKIEPQLDGKYFIARTILVGWQPWNAGPLERFLY